MTAYAIGILNDISMGPAIVDYLERIDDTLRSHGGRFIIHGASNVMHEGEDPGTIVVIEFDDLDAASRWYDSAEYREIIPLRADNSSSVILTIDGVTSDHRATDVLRATP